MNQSTQASRSTAEAQTLSDFLQLVQQIGRHAPPIRGKNFLIRNALLKLARTLPSDATIVTRDGLRFQHCNLNQYIYRELAVYGMWEADVTWIYDRILAPGDAVLDVGACFGYHALRAAPLVGPRGTVYAVEPQPDVFATLRKNIAANQFANIEAECLAFASEEGSIELHRFDGLDLGNTSVSTLNRTDYSAIQCRAVRVDRYIAGRRRSDVAVVKVDVEGAELAVLKGADGLLSSKKPPMWVVEINDATAQSCGYHPNDLLDLLRGRGYSFYRPVWGRVVRTIEKMEKCQYGRHGENLLCLIEEIHSDRLLRVLSPMRMRPSSGKTAT